MAIVPMNADTQSVPLIDLSALATIIRRHKWPMLLAALVVCLLTAAAYLLAEPSYQGQAVVALDRTEEKLIRTQGEQQSSIVTDSPSVDTQVQVLMSPSLAETAVRRSKLNQNAQFIRAFDKSYAGGGVPVELAATWLRSSLEVARTGQSYAIELKFNSIDPEVAALGANAMTDAYVNGQIQDKADSRDREIALLRARLDQLRGGVISAETAVAQYRSATNLVDIENNSTSAQQELSALNTLLAQAQADNAVASAQARTNAGRDSGTLVINSPVIRDLRVEATKLSTQQADLAKRYGPSHPERMQVESQLAAVNNAISREVSRVQSGVSGDAQVARDRVSAIQSSIAKSRGQLIAGNNASVRLNELQREADSARQIYQAFLDRYRTQLATQGTDGGNAYVIARAEAPVIPVSPDRLIFIMAGVIAALAAAAAVAFLLELRERGLRTRAEAEEKLHLPVVSSIPDITTVPNAGFTGDGSSLALADYLVSHDGSVFNEAFRSIRAALKIGQPGQVAKVVAVTSAMPAEGKTTTAICLARSAAMAGIRTVLVDSDVRKHASSRTLTASPRVGLAEVLRGSAKLEEALLLDSASGAYILPQAPNGSPAYDAVLSTAMEKLLAELSESFGLIVLDTAPVLPVAEARVIAAMADITLMVVQWRETRVSSAKAAIDQLERAGARMFGTILTQVNLKSLASNTDEMVYYHNYEIPSIA